MAKMHNADPAMARRHHCPIGINEAGLDCSHCPYRRVILVEVDHPAGSHVSGDALLSLNFTRTPVVALDVDTRSGEIIGVTKVGPATAWENVPTPAM
jgi:hypothetical protein